MLARHLANPWPVPLASEAFHRITEAGYRRKQEGGFIIPMEGPQVFDIP
jgi:hypothetical protein